MVAAEGNARAVLDPPAPGGSGALRWSVGTTVHDASAGWELNDWDDLSPTTNPAMLIWVLQVRDSIGGADWWTWALPNPVPDRAAGVALRRLKITSAVPLVTSAWPPRRG